MEATFTTRTYGFNGINIAIAIDAEGNRRIVIGDDEQPYREIALTRKEAFCVGAALYDEFMKFDKAYVGIEPT